MAVSTLALQVNGSIQKHSNNIPSFNHLKASLSSTLKPLWKDLQLMPLKVDVLKSINSTTGIIFDAFVDSVFRFVDQPLLPLQRNFGPVEEIGAAVEVDCVEGKIPTDFPEGIYIRNGPNPLFGGLKSAVSIFGTSSHTWVEGEGMLHAVYFKHDESGDWVISYHNKYVESETLKLERERKKPGFFPTLEGDPTAILAAYLLNTLRFGMVNKYLCSTSVFEHSGKFYSITENHLPHEIDIFTLDTLDSWNVAGSWNRPFTSHPKKAPGTGELVIMGVDGQKPFYEVGVISADGKTLSHKVDLKFNTIIFSHEIGVTLKYNIIMDHPLTVDIQRVFKGGQLVEYNKEGQARIGVMPRYGDANSVQWFTVEPHCTFHILNSYEDGDEVVVRGCRALNSIIPGPQWGENKFDWFSRGFKPIKLVDQEHVDGSSEEDGHLFSRVYEWRLNMVTGEVMERNLTGIDFSMDFPLVNENYTGLKHKYGYTQVVHSVASSSCGLAKYGSLAKLYFEEPDYTQTVREGQQRQLIKVEYHRFEENNFCTGISFVPKCGGDEEDDGWIVTFVHNEDTNVSQVLIIDAKKLGSEPIAKITLPQRVPYGFHGTFISMANQLS